MHKEKKTVFTLSEYKVKTVLSLRNSHKIQFMNSITFFSWHSISTIVQLGYLSCITFFFFQNTKAVLFSLIYLFFIHNRNITQHFITKFILTALPNSIKSYFFFPHICLPEGVGWVVGMVCRWGTAQSHQILPGCIPAGDSSRQVQDSPQFSRKHKGGLQHCSHKYHRS